MITRDAAHRYTDTETGKQYVSVTTALDVLDKSRPLMTWMGNQVASACVRMLPELPKMLETLGEEAVIKALTSRGNFTRDTAAQLGTDVHALADLVVRGQPTPPMDETRRARVLHYAKWWEGELKAGAHLRLSEAMILTPDQDGTPETGWAGTFDLLYRDGDGATVLADIKTGGKWGRKVYESEVLQVTAYGMGRFVQPATDDLSVPPAIYPMPIPDKYKIIHVTGEGCKAIPVDVTQRERMAWLSCLDLYHWQQNLKRKT